MMQIDEDEIKFSVKRQRLVNEIHRKGIKSQAVLDAINEVPRHKFFAHDLVQFAYHDNAYMIEAGQTISQPYTVAFQTQLLNIKPGNSVLEIGTGSGYQAAVLCNMGMQVVTIERHEELYRKSTNTLQKLGYKAHTIFGDGFAGYAKLAPYDAIIVTAAAPHVPKALLLQLKIGGCMVVPLGKGATQIMTRITRVDEKDYKSEQFGDFAFVPMIKGTN